MATLPARFENESEPGGAERDGGEHDGGDFGYKLNGIKWEEVPIVSKIKPGDHISYYKFPYNRHAIVVEVNQDNQTLLVVGWRKYK